MLILSTRKATIVYNLFQYQDFNSDCVHFPNPYLPRVKNEDGKWVVGSRGQCTHGVKWKLPSTLADFFAQPNLILTGRSVVSDLTRLNNVFFGNDDTSMLIVKTLDISDLKVFEPYKTQRERCAREKKPFENGLTHWYVPYPPVTIIDSPSPACIHPCRPTRVTESCYICRLQRVTGMQLKDKGQRTDIRVSGWASVKRLSKEKIAYAAKDGMASLILGQELRKRRMGHLRRFASRMNEILPFKSILGENNSVKAGCRARDRGGMLPDTLCNTAGKSCVPHPIPHPASHVFSTHRRRQPLQSQVPEYCRTLACVPHAGIRRVSRPFQSDVPQS